LTCTNKTKISSKNDFERNPLGVSPQMELNAAMRDVAEDALLGLLFPFWQLVIGVVLLVVTIISAHRLLMRGPSRMGRAIVVAGSAVICVIALGFLISMA
jgi:hypothetical protein